MSAWEITTDDVRVVLNAHGVTQDENQWYDKLDCDEIEKSVLDHTNFDQQCDQALSDVEDQLAEHGAFKHLSPYVKKFTVGADGDYVDPAPIQGLLGDLFKS